MKFTDRQFSQNRQNAWKSAIFGTFFIILLETIFLWGGVRSAVSLWIHSGTYNHCFLILPIFFYLLWSGRAELADLSPRPSPWGGIVILAFLVLWGLSYLSGIAEGMHVAIVGIIQGVVLSLFGGAVYRRLWLSFSLLWLLVPSGDVLVPALQRITATAAAALLDGIGIPTYRDGMAIDVPSGRYVVAPACAGLNFLLAALATGIAYAQLMYRHGGRRLTFVLALLALAICGNIMRVFLIIAIAHLTDNFGDIVDDHLLYGWIFFSLLLLAAMALGQRYREDHGAPPAPSASASAVAAPPARFLAAALMAALPIVAVAIAVPRSLPAVARPEAWVPALHCAAPLAAQPGWPPAVEQVDAMKSLDCRWQGRAVHLVVAVLERPIRRGKLFDVERWLEGSAAWSQGDRQSTMMTVADRPVPIQIRRESDGKRQRTVGTLYWADAGWRRAGWTAAWFDLRAEFGGHRRAVVILAASDGDDAPALESLLRSFLASQPLDQLVVGP